MRYKNTITELNKKLKLIQEVNGHTKIIFPQSEIIDSIKTGKTKVLKSEWRGWDYYKNEIDHYKIDLTNSKTWITYDDCFYFNLYQENKNLICEIRIATRTRAYDNYEIKEKIKATLLLENKLIKSFKDQINQDYQYHLSQKYNEYLEDQKQKWMQKHSDKLLK